MHKAVVILLGPPGAGKGTQAARLASALEVPAISTGEILRRECELQGHWRRELETCLRSGRLVSNELMNRMVFARLREADCRRGFILDGYPRTVSQARYLDGIFACLGIQEPTILDFEIPAEESVARLESRRRTDDHASAIRERLRNYQANAAELARYYRVREYHAFSAAGTPDEVADEISRTLDILVTT